VNVFDWQSLTLYVAVIVYVVAVADIHCGRQRLWPSLIWSSLFVAIMDVAVMEQHVTIMVRGRHRRSPLQITLYCDAVHVSLYRQQRPGFFTVVELQCRVDEFPLKQTTNKHACQVPHTRSTWQIFCVLDSILPVILSCKPSCKPSTTEPSSFPEADKLTKPI